ncbi:recombination protein NinB [Methylorubrum zatmanii]|uniref:Recombination protein NinB n=1 Tax=Methylorubrum zatmanii TaxID=29429 RepID=A0ABW1WNR6_9HYPH|nr:recombination protein NinB [Methylorubrum zatmanii]MBD8906853.1 hypothetical protein [Methylorubrum zatmanii]
MAARHILRLANDVVRQRAIRWILKAPEGMLVEFREDTRSLDQNAKLWPMLDDVARQVEWYGQRLTSDEWKDVFTASLRKSRVVPGLDAGTFVVLGLHTSKLKKAEFSDLIELIYAFGAERDVVWSEPAPRDERRAA